MKARARAHRLAVEHAALAQADPHPRATALVLGARVRVEVEGGDVLLLRGEVRVRVEGER